MLFASSVCRQVQSDLCKLLVGQPKLGRRRLLHPEEITDTPAEPNLWVQSIDMSYQLHYRIQLINVYNINNLFYIVYEPFVRIIDTFRERYIWLPT